MASPTQRKKARRKAGHRSWAARGGRVAGVHQGDFMSPEQRSRVMAKIKGKHTGPERAIMMALTSRGLKFESHVSQLPGRPDVVFRDEQVAVFIDGDFWHGWRFPLWQHKLAQKWQEKISTTRKRDKRNFSRLRRQGWRVLRIWEHQVESHVEKCVEKIVAVLICT